MRFLPVLVGSALVGALGASICAAAPTDIVPRGDIAYDLLGSLAAAGKIPGYTLADFARGDRLYTRAEIAVFVLRAAPNAEAQDAAIFRALEIRFAAELHQLSPRFALTPNIPAKNGILTGQGKVRLLFGPTAGTGTYRVSGTQPIGRDGFASVTVSNFRREWYDQTRVERQGGFSDIETAFVRVNGRALDVMVGVQPLRWGPGYAGAMLVSDTAPSIPQISVEKSFLLPGTVGRRVGRLRFSQFMGEFSEDDVPTAAPNARGTRRYIGGRRVETEGRGPWTLAFSEAFKSTRLPGAPFAAVLPFYLYQNEWTSTSSHRTLRFLASDPQDNTFWFNYLNDFNVVYRTGKDNSPVLYGDLLLDDIKAPTGLGLGDNTPRKIGYQLGAYAPRLGSPQSRYGLRLEYANIDTGTYTNISPPVAWSEDGIPLAHPAGPNASVFFARLDSEVSSKVRVAVEGQSRRRKNSDNTSSPDTSRVGLYATYAVRRDAFFGLRYEHQRETFPAETHRSRFEGNVTFGF